jgi:P27 family predicted phage terminase small subunit
MGGKGSGGANAKPTKLKKLLGNPGKRKLNDKEPKAVPGRPAIPAFVRGEARAWWPRICSMIEELGVLTKSDGLAVAALCSSIGQLVKAEAAIEKFGMIFATVDETTGVATHKVNPAVRVKSDALRHMNSLLGQFGLSPSTRSKLKIDAPSEPDPFESFLSQDSEAQNTKKPN